jgi:hypothetical protein
MFTVLWDNDGVLVDTEVGGNELPNRFAAVLMATEQVGDVRRVGRSARTPLAKVGMRLIMDDHVSLTRGGRMNHACPPSVFPAILTLCPSRKRGVRDGSGS